METLLVIGYFFLFAWIILKGKFFTGEGISKSHLIVAFGVKVFSGIVLGFIYLYYYTERSTADTLKFFDDSRQLFDLLKTNPHQFFQIFTGIHADDPELTPVYLKMNTWMYEEFLNPNRTMVRIDTLFRFFIPGNYYFVHVVFINFISFTGLLYLYKVLSNQLALNRTLIYLSVFFAPSLLFWGSGLLKEGILIFALGGFLFHYFLFLGEKRTYLHAVQMMLFGLLLTVIKVYMLMVLAPVLAACFWSSVQNKNVLLKYVLSSVFFFAVLFNMKSVIPRYDLSHYLYIKQRDFLDIVKTQKPASAIQIPVIEPSLGSIVKNSPQGFITTLTRPYLFESLSPVILMASIENSLIVILIILCIFFFKRPIPREKNFIAFSIGLTVILFTLVGLVTPVEGAIVRYKSIALPFLFVALFSLTDLNRLKKRAGISFPGP